MSQQFTSVDGTAMAQPTPNGKMAWFCIRTHPKHEHIAAAQLRQEAGLEIFLPRIRYKRSTRCGMAWVTEALFRDYFFARFDLDLSLRRVQHARAVRGVVHFGSRWPAVPESVITGLRTAFGGEDIRHIDETLAPGDQVEIAGGPMHGLAAVVGRVMPGQQRVAVLLEFLGRQTMVELSRSQLALADGQQSRKAHLAVWGITWRNCGCSVRK